MIARVDSSQMFTIVRFDDLCFPRVLDVLTDAFQDDPLIRHMFPTDTKEKSRPFFNFLLVKSILLNELLLGIECNGELIGIANLEEPARNKVSIFRIGKLIYQSLRFAFRISFRNFIFINNYMKLTSSLRPKNPNHYLIFISTAPKHQGKGAGRMLLDHIHSLVEQSPHSSGIGLDTENSQNISLYERFGYKLIGTELIGPVTIYSMFRPKS